MPPDPDWVASPERPVSGGVLPQCSALWDTAAKACSAASIATRPDVPGWATVPWEQHWCTRRVPTGPH